MRPPWFERRDYDTRIDRFRAKEGISILKWATEAGMKRSQFNKYRTGAEARTDLVARLVRAATRILGRPVRASELFDLGEEIPVAERAASAPSFLRNDLMRKDYPSRIDALLRLLGIPPNAFARQIGMSRRQLTRLRRDESFPFVGTVRHMVEVLRCSGYDVTASDIADVGEDEATP